MDKTFLGLDIGSNSIGWCVTDQDFKIKKLNNVNAWGARLFDDASDAKQRKGFRSYKRRIERRKSRIYLLNRMFVEEISKVDDSFFIRLSESNLCCNDKSIKNKNVFFNEPGKEKEFYKKYPTIYHLRKALIEDDKDAFSDIRNVYIAIHHIIKYRGNFLSENEVSFNDFDEENIVNLNSCLNKILSEEDENGLCYDKIFIDKNKANDLIGVLLNPNIKDKKNRQKELLKLFNLDGLEKDFVDDKISFFCKMAVGSKCTLTVDGEEIKDIVIDNKIDEKLSEYESKLGSLFGLLKIAKECHDFAFIKKLLKDSKYLSDAYVKIYEKHNKDLKDLKEIIKEIDNNKDGGSHDLYKKVFKDKNTYDDKKKTGNYVSFVKTNEDSKSIKDNVSGFDTFIKNILNENLKYIQNEKNLHRAKEILTSCENNEFMLKISNVSTSEIPHQLHEFELRKILENAKMYYLFIDDDFINRVLRIFKFRVPYYYGPLNSNNWGNVVKKEGYENTKVSFDNYEEIIDVEKTKTKFINSRLNKCQYLLTEPVLPRYSIYYVVYDLLDKLNTITYNNVHLTIKEKEYAISVIVNSNNQIGIKTLNKKLKEYFNGSSRYKVDDISGIDKDYKFNGFPINVFLDVFNGDKNKLEENIKDVEEIIRILTAYKDSRIDAMEIIEERFSYLSKEQINKIKKSPMFKGYGSFSSKLLTQIKFNNKSVLDLLIETNKNFNQIMFDSEFDFESKIKEINKEAFGEKTKTELVNEIIDDMPSKMKRPVIQTLAIIKDIIRANKKSLDVISIETTRQDLMPEKKKTTKSRYKKIQEFVSKIIKEKDLTEDIKKAAILTKDELDKHKDDTDFENKLKGKHLYLYFMQLGIDMYTGEHIDINDVFDSTQYDIDHIVPQSKIKDDSLDNTVLVKREINQKVKKDIYPVPESIRTKMLSIWEFMLKKELISKSKYSRLIRSKPLTEDELNDFVNAQLKVVDYANLRIRDILKIMYPNTEIIFSKAQYPSEIRHNYGFYKIRDLNDCHHAYDAYLNIVCGILLNERFTKNYRLMSIYDKNLKLNEEEKTHNFLNYLEYKIDNLNLYDTLKEYYLSTDMLFTYKLSYEEDAFYKQTTFKKGQDSLIPIHTNGAMKDTSKYGGYKSRSTKYFYVGSKTNKKGNIEKVLVTVDSLTYALCCEKGVLNENKLLEKLKGCNSDIDIDLSKKVINYQKVIINNREYLLRSNNELQVSLSPLFALSYKIDDLYFIKCIFEDKYSINDNLLTYGKSKELTTSLTKEQLICKIKNIINDFKEEEFLSISIIINCYKKLKDIIESRDNKDISIETIIIGFKKYMETLKRAPNPKIVAKYKPYKTGVLQIVDYFVEESPSGLYKRYIKV